MTRISQAIWKQVQQNCMALSHVAKHHTLQVNSKMIRHLTLSALVLASIPTSAVFVSANETVTDHQDSEIAVQKFIYKGDIDPEPDSDEPEPINKSKAETTNKTSTSKTSSTNNTVVSAENTTTEDDLHFISINGGKTTDKNYANNGATGTDSMVIGIGSSTSSSNAMVLGNNNYLSGTGSIAVGRNLYVQGSKNNVVVGVDYTSGVASENRQTHVSGEFNTVYGVANLVGYTFDGKNYKLNDGHQKDLGTPNQNVAIGLGNTVNGGSVIVGKDSVAQQSTSMFGIANTQIGKDDYGVALGNHLKISGYGALAVGSYSAASSYGAIAIGSGYVTGAEATNNSAIAMGYQAKALAKYAMSVGRESKSDKESAIAFGYQASSTVEGGIALGASSVANVEKGILGFDPDAWNEKMNFDPESSVWKSTLGAISVGSRTGETRQIINVAAGTKDTDAVNVAQLKRAIKDSYDDRQEIKSDIRTIIKNDEGKPGTDTKIETISGKYDKANKKLNLTLTDNTGTDIDGIIDMAGLVSDDSGLTKDTKNTVVAGDHIEVDSTKPNDFGGTEYKISVKVDGKVEEDNTGLVSGGTIYNETRVEEDGNYVQKSNTAGENLTALDTQVKRNADSIISLGDTVYDLSNRVGEMDDRINKVGAGAAALAALHPLDYDPEDKWDIAAGFGNYKNASAGALGLFYRPNERTQFNVGWTMGDDRNMFNAGFSVKLGQGSSYAGYSKADMVQLIEKQKGQITVLEATIGEQEKEIQQIEEQMHALMERLEKNRYMAENGDL